MFTKYISSALLFLVFAQGTLAVVCGNPPLPACPPPCVPACTTLAALAAYWFGFLQYILTRPEQAPPQNIAASPSRALDASHRT
ncbi:hypothetical protein C8R47DRAFT_1136240 [Mycena vitilis]|nr:hypothetical protein C8R47DRAFT_1136240 [Mycena vitilis]